MNIRTCNLIVAAFAVLLSACGETSSNSTDAAPAAAASPRISIGDTGKAAGIEFTVTAVATPSQIGPAGLGPKAEAGETFVVISYTLKNTSEDTLSLMERPGLSLLDANGKAFASDDMASPMAAGMMDDASGMAADLNPNVSAKTKTAWKVDKAAFDRGTWTLAVATDPALTFLLK